MKVSIKYDQFNSNINCQIKYVVVMALYQDKWIFVRHKDRLTYEIPGGKVEEKEEFHKAARRELVEETGASKFRITPLDIFHIILNENEVFSSGILYYSEVDEIGPLPESEIAEIILSNNLPSSLTHRPTHAYLYERAIQKTQAIHLSHYFFN